MERMVGTVARGLRAPIIRQGDDLEQIVVDTVLKASETEGFVLRDKDIISITEAVVARAQGNYATVDQIAEDVKAKLRSDTVGVVFPIQSRNRFSICLRGIAKGTKRVIVLLSYPKDEVGNPLVDIDLLDNKGINPYTDVLTRTQFEDLFGKAKHTFTGIDYVNYYKELIEGEGAEAVILFANNPKVILNYTKVVLACDIHTRERTKRILKSAGAEVVYGLDDLMPSSLNGSGYNSQYGRSH